MRTIVKGGCDLWRAIHRGRFLLSAFQISAFSPLTLPSSFASLNRQFDVAVQRQLAGENIPVECQ